ncbi:uncharacterized protein LOC110703091 [Chenopodium quinoa]|uniref:uncharacterized protein LOC110703091 n=1 Tax=Chenopodium quinoa TaxID=63459 RepID=UPI000B781631|nr:uncharacterized protein LOC110703091 [Chenopodium quinoa]
MKSSRKWAKSISSISSCLYFLLIIFQVPLFRVPCRSGICITPVQVTSSQLIASEVLPVSFVKILLYPGAIVNALINGINIPNYDDLLEIYNFTHVKEASAIIDLRHLEIITLNNFLRTVIQILAGSYFCVVGAILGLLKNGRLSLFGSLLLIWGLFKEIMRQKSTCLDYCQSVEVSPIMLVALFTALSSIRSDVRAVVKSFQAHQLATAAVDLDEHIKKRKKDREMKRLEWNVNYVSSTATTPRSTKIAQQGIKNTFY